MDKEDVIRGLERDGFYVTEKGWPDFVVSNPKTRKFVTVVIAPSAVAQLKRKRILVIYFLTSANIKCYRIDGDDTFLIRCWESKKVNGRSIICDARFHYWIEWNDDAPVITKQVAGRCSCDRKPMGGRRVLP